MILLFIGLILTGKVDSQQIDTALMRATAQDNIRLALETGTNSLGIEREAILLKEAAELFKSIDDWPNHIYSLCVLASYNYQQGHYFQWNAYMDSIDVLAPKYLEEYSEFDLTHKTLKTRQLIQNGQILKAIGLLEKVLSKPKFLTNEYLKISFIEKLAHAYELAGDYEKAKRTIIPGIAIIPHPLNKGRALAQLSRIYYKEKNYDKCLSTISESIELLASVNTNEIFQLELWKRYIDKAEYLLEYNDKDSSLYYTELVLEESSKIPDELLARSLLVKARIYQMEGKARLASILASQGYESMRASQPLHSQLKFKSAESAMVFNQILMENEDFVSSENLLLQAFDDIGIHDFGHFENQVHPHNYSIVIKLLSLLSDTKLSIYRQTNQNGYLDVAVDLQKRIFYVLAKMRKSDLDETYLNFWASENQTLNEKAIQICLLAERIDLVFSFMEENKSNLLAKNINEQMAKGTTLISTELLNEEKRFRSHMHVLRMELDAILQDSLSTTEKLTNIGDEINKTQIKLNKVISRIKNQNSDYHSFIYDDNLLSIENLQISLDPKSAMIEYFIGDKDSYVIRITNSSFKLYPLKTLINKREDVEKFRLLMRDSLREVLQLYAISSDWYTDFFRDLLDDIEGEITDLIIVPDGFLTNFPFELIRDSNHKYLVERFNIHYQYSARLHGMLKKRKPPTHTYDLIAYGYDENYPTLAPNRSCDNTNMSSLMCATKEVEYIGDELNERNIKTDLKNSQDIFDIAAKSSVIHLATHSCFDENDVHQSRIYFKDGSLTLREIQNLNLRTELTVLSSCESGFGKLIKGEGGMSISKAFIRSGSNSTLVSLWPVDDCTTSELMRSFYTHLNLGMKKNEALRKAKLQYLNDAHPSRKHPYYWAGFVLVGDESAIWEEITSNSSMHIIICLLLLGLCVVLTIFLKKKLYK